MQNTILKELDLATLRQDLPAYGLIAGDIGTVVQVYANGAAYEVEFLTTDGRTLAVETLQADQVDPVTGRRVLHARKLAAL
jgi:glutaminase